MKASRRRRYRLRATCRRSMQAVETGIGIRLDFAAVPSTLALAGSGTIAAVSEWSRHRGEVFALRRRRLGEIVPSWRRRRGVTTEWIDASDGRW